MYIYIHIHTLFICIYMSIYICTFFDGPYGISKGMRPTKLEQYVQTSPCLLREAMSESQSGPPKYPKQWLIYPLTREREREREREDRERDSHIVLLIISALNLPYIIPSRVTDPAISSYSRLNSKPAV